MDELTWTPLTIATVFRFVVQTAMRRRSKETRSQESDYLFLFAGVIGRAVAPGDLTYNQVLISNCHLRRADSF